jgi:hypothetical protein
MVGIVATLTVLASSAGALNPETDLRTQVVAQEFSQVTVCVGGPRDKQPCVPFSGDPSETCENVNSLPGFTDGTCTGIQNARIVARGILTLIADTKLNVSSGDLGPYLEEKPGLPCTTCEGAGNSSLTLVLEFTRDGKSYVFADTYQGLNTNTVSGFVTTSNSGLPGDLPNWDFGAFESSFTSANLLIKWAAVPPGARAGIVAALGESDPPGGPNKQPLLLSANEIPVCTDTATCNHGVFNTKFADHAAGDDVLASVRRFKVDIGFLGP